MLEKGDGAEEVGVGREREWQSVMRRLAVLHTAHMRHTNHAPAQHGGPGSHSEPQ